MTGTSISGDTRFVCLLGNPTAHSLSPAMHNLSFELLGIDAVYTCFDVDEADMGPIVAAFKAMERWDGFNCTMPCKHAIIPQLDELDEAAALIGAVNVVSKRDGRAIGHNTDGVGFMNNLVKHGVTVRGARMALLGPGGAGSAILAQAALDGMAHIDVFARPGGSSAADAQGLVERIARTTECTVKLRDLSDSGELADGIAQASILVNATPVGMGESCEDTLVPPELMRSGLTVADVIYHPRKTRLIRDAESCGCTTVPGLGMLLEQAAAGEAIWYGARMPIDEISRRLF